MLVPRKQEGQRNADPHEKEEKPTKTDVEKLVIGKPIVKKKKAP